MMIKIIDALLSLPIALLALFLPRDEKTWALLVNFHQPFEGNLRTLAHYLLNNGEHTVYILDYRPQRQREPLADTKGLTVVSGGSWRELIARLRARNIVFTHGIKETLGRYRWIRGVRLINTWHGIPIKGMANMDHAYSRKHIRGKKIRQNDRLHTFCVASEIERSFMAACHLMDAEKIRIVGTPRTDILLRDDALDEQQQRQQQDIIACKAGRSMLLYAPTFRDYDRTKIGLTAELCQALSVCMQKHNTVLALRPHPRDHQLFSDIAANLPHLIMADAARWPDSTVVLKHSDALITDYSSVWIEYLLLNRPMLAYCWDLSRYTQRRGFLFDFKALFPGEIVETGEELLTAMNKLCGEQLQLSEPRRDLHQRITRLFHHHRDGQSCQRIMHLGENNE